VPKPGPHSLRRRCAGRPRAAEGTATVDEEGEGERAGFASVDGGIPGGHGINALRSAKPSTRVGGDHQGIFRRGRREFAPEWAAPGELEVHRASVSQGSYSQQIAERRGGTNVRKKLPP